MQANLDVALLTQRFTVWHGTFAVMIAVLAAVVLVTTITALIKPRVVPRIALLVPFVLGLWVM